MVLISALKIDRSHMSAEGATEVGHKQMFGIDCIGFQSCAVAKDGYQPCIKRARKVENVGSYREALYVGDERREAAQPGSMLLASRFFHISPVLPDHNMGEHIIYLSCSIN